jgi:hypothetical protein
VVVVVEQVVLEELVLAALEETAGLVLLLLLLDHLFNTQVAVVQVAEQLLVRQVLVVVLEAFQIQRQLLEHQTRVVAEAEAVTFQHKGLVGRVALVL